MKIVKVIAMSIVGASLVSFSLSKSVVEKKHQNSYELDKVNSTLGWKGGKNDSYFHTGKIQFSEGNLVLEHGVIVSGNFVVDMSTIACTDAGLPKEKQDGLAKHLKDVDFFNIVKYATTKVTIGAYKEGKLSTTINVLGVDIKQDIPVVFVSNEKGASIIGKFDVDFSAAKIPGTEVQEGDKESVKPVFSFDLNLILKAKQ